MKRGSSIFRTFVVPFILTIIFTGGIIGYIGNNNTNALTDKLFTALIKDIDGRIEKEVGTFMSEPQVSAQKYEDLIRYAKDPAETKEHLLLDFLQNIKNSDSIFSIEYADEQNETYGVVKGVFGLEYGYTVSGKETNYTYTLREVTSKFEFDHKIVWDIKDYDVREKEWYKQGITGETQQWTPIYAWPNGDVGLDSLTQVYSGDKKIGVIDTSVTLGTIRTFLTELLTDQVTGLYVVEGDGLLVAGTDIEKPVTIGENETAERISAKSSASGILSAIYASIEQRGGLSALADSTIEKLEYQDKEVVYSVTSYADEYGLKWYIITVINPQSVIGSVSTANRTSLLAASILLVLGVIIAYVVSREVTDPISQLAKNVLRFSEHPNGEHTLPKNLKGEVGTLVSSIEKMMKKIKSQVHELQEKEHQLGIENEKLELILASIGEVVVLLDTKERVIYQNPSADRLSSVKKEQIIGKEFKNVLPFVGSSHDALKFITVALETRQIQSNAEPQEIESKDGQKRVFVMTAAPIIQNNNELYGVVVIMRDITEERQIEEAKTDIVSLASHQLRTPLSAAKWYTELLATDMKGLSKIQKENVERIKSAVDRMIVQVNVLLNATQVELGLTHIELETIGIEDFIYETLQLFEKERRAKALSISVDVAKNVALVETDRRILQTVLQNLISNAVKYTKEKGKVSISVTKKGKVVQIGVQDTGIGIPEQDKQRIFTRLFRGDSAVKHDPNGNGVGLYIAQTLIKNLGGTITFTSTEGKGSSFIATFPSNS